MVNEVKFYLIFANPINLYAHEPRNLYNTSTSCRAI
uniref:Uncharacterized protein n=1 Tax=Rhizophora mucronata TaxID=61149 RepID=A0A2P2IX12_RHIMU